MEEQNIYDIYEIDGKYYIPMELLDLDYLIAIQEDYIDTGKYKKVSIVKEEDT